MPSAFPMTLAAWLHDLNPFVLRISQDFGIRWYGVAYAVGFLLAWAQLRWLARRGASRLSEPRVADAMATLIFGVLLGGRLGYCLVYDPALLTLVTDHFPFWGVLMINKGGMAFHGAVVGVIVASWQIARGPRDDSGLRSQRMPWLHVLDLTAFAAPAGLMLGRIANFVNGELLGQVVAMPGQPAPWWAVKYPQEIGSDHIHDPSTFYTPEQLQKLQELVAKFTPRGGTFDDGVVRMMQALQDHSSSAGGGHAQLVASLSPLVSARHPSQLYQAFVEGPVLALFLWIIWRRPRLPGIVGCWFLILYGILRAIIEQFFRLPDPQLVHQRILGLSRGQWLSLAMVAFGAGFIAVISARAKKNAGAVRLGGWGAQSAG